MDIEQARTFLALVETRSFIRTAERLNVTQSTVSMRLKVLEDRLGQTLFVRGKSGATLTAAGTHFRPYAETIVRAWEQARHEVALPPLFRGTFAVGAETILWGRLLLKWIPWMRSAMPDVCVRAEVGPSEGLMRQLIEGLLDAAILYAPQTRPGLVIEQLLEERMVMVTTDPAIRFPGDEGYVYVDWGPEFRAAHGAAFPGAETPVLFVGHGPLGLQYILENGGAGFFPLRAVRELIQEGRLSRVHEDLEIARPVHMVYAAAREEEWFRTALQGLRYVAADEAETSSPS
jgi:LysR family transcriptional regulator, flagellar master operon regulator